MVYNDNFYNDASLYIEPKIDFKSSSFDTKKIKNLFFRKRIINFVQVMERNYSKDNLRLMYHNLETLKMKIYFFNRDGQGCYDDTNNIVKIQYGHDYALEHELIHMSSCINMDKFLYCGFCIKKNIEMPPILVIGRPLSEGFTQKYTMDLFPNSIYSRAYCYYVLVATLLEDIIGQKRCQDLFFSANLKGLIDELLKYKSFEEITSFLKHFDRLHYRLFFGESFCRYLFKEEFIPMNECFNQINVFFGSINSSYAKELEFTKNQMLSR